MKHAVYCGTKNLYGDMQTAAKSLIANSDVDKVWLLTEGDFDYWMPDMCEVVDVSGQEWFDLEGPNVCAKWSWMVLMRTALALMPEFSGVGRIASFDCDTVCVGDVSPLWEIDLSGCYFAAVQEKWACARTGLEYRNVGVMVQNLNLMRETGKAEEVVGALNRHRFTWPDQDALNYLCQGFTQDLPSGYNKCPWVVDDGSEDRVIHYAARDDWRDEPVVVEYRTMGWDDVMMRHEEAVERAMTVVFASNHGLDRNENLKAVWDAYDGPKRFVKGVGNVAGEACRVVVCDTLMPFFPGKPFKVVNIGHGITGGKLYGLDEQRSGIDPEALAQTDYAISTGTAVTAITAGHFGIPEERALPLGMPRTDSYIGKKKGGGGTRFAEYGRVYLYAPTFRGKNDGDKLPDIDWAKLDSMLEDDEVLVVKRHYFTGDELTCGEYAHIAEVPYSEPSEAYLVDCDVLVTDYSSIMFDAWLLGKPVVLDTSDADAYLSTRGMYFDYPNGYSPRNLVVEGNEDELLSTLRKAARYGMTKTERERITHVADMCDGHSSDRVCDLVRSLL